MDKPVNVRSLKELLGLKQFIGENANFVAEVKKIPLIARYDVPVLITGETGTGKELCARAIHYLSPRSGEPFLAVNCGAMRTELLENELFGHEAEAFTGAAGSKPGVIAEADGGTLFLDEIDSLPAQAMLLRFLQEGEFKPLGSSKTKKADVRVIAATNSDIEQALHTHSIREDLFYRLSVVSIHLPPLRERKDDIPLLANFFYPSGQVGSGKTFRQFHRKP
jgi:transcriptional regulator with PAS, ATPase and Fis domain